MLLIRFMTTFQATKNGFILRAQVSHPHLGENATSVEPGAQRVRRACMMGHTKCMKDLGWKPDLH